MDKGLDELVATINKSNRLRVWSVIITFFGDAIVPRGSAVSARTVQEVMARLGIGAGAVRTAFSRLTQDGWLVREKKGRASFYQISKRGREPFEAASREIYAPVQSNQLNSKAWLIAIHRQSTRTPTLIEFPTPHDFVRLKEEDCLLISGQLENIPEWVMSQLAPPEAALGYRQLIQAFSPIAANKQSDIDSLATRTILIHEWRRVLLRYHHVSPQLRPTEWPEDACHSLVAELYQSLLGPSEVWLNTHATGPDGQLPPPIGTVETRFS